jgi:hypothetical protein
MPHPLTAQGYRDVLDRSIDVLFAYATYVCDITWDEWAAKAGVSVSTVYRLGRRITMYPQDRTFEKLAHACGLKRGFLNSQGQVVGRSKPARAQFKRAA